MASAAAPLAEQQKRFKELLGKPIYTPKALASRPCMLSMYALSSQRILFIHPSETADVGRIAAYYDRQIQEERAAETLIADVRRKMTAAQLAEFAALADHDVPAMCAYLHKLDKRIPAVCTCCAK